VIPVVDIHCHPSLKVYLLDADMFEEHVTTRDFNPFVSRVDLPKMKKGNVRAIFNTHYLPEIGFRTECPGVDWLYGGINFLAPDVTDKLEYDNNFNSPFEQTIQMINLCESKINEARSKGVDVEIARNYHQFKTGWEKGKTMILHAIEGAHSLGRKGSKHSSVLNDYIDNLEQFCQKGVCLITLAHFFGNDIVSPVNGIPPGVRRILGMKSRDLNQTLTPIGESVVRRMFELGIIVDLTHSTPIARKRVFEINGGRRPIVFSHVGVESLFNNPQIPEDRYMNPSDEEIVKIAECGGVIGIEFDNYWLTGKEEESVFIKEPGFEYIYKTIMHIYAVTGTYDNAAFGSDLDGLTDPSDDIKDCSYYPDLIKYLTAKGISSADLCKICYENVFRILKNGWGKKES
jgi:microsomal dipeptidase-like Zn-dependent dipeptidase